MTVRDLIEKLKLLDKELLKNENLLKSWKIAAEVILSDESVSCAPTLRDGLEICQKTSAVQNLEFGLSAKTPLLLQLACSFQWPEAQIPGFLRPLFAVLSRFWCAVAFALHSLEATKEAVLDITLAGMAVLASPASVAPHWAAGLLEAAKEFPENASEFLSSLNKNLNTVQNEIYSSDGQAASKTEPVMQEGGVWVISDGASANAADELMLTSGLPPSRLKVTWTCKPEQQFALLMNCSKQLEVDIRLDCFSNFEKTSEENRGLCSSLINVSARCSITHFWGQFDNTGLYRLPRTIQSVGLVLRDQYDLQTLNSICGTIFTQTYCANEREQLVWRDWTELNLSMASTFLPEYWNLSSWWYYNAQGRQEYVTLSTALSNFGIRLRLFLNQLVPGDYCWMRKILHSMEISFFDRVPLFLPGASIDLDPLLGVLRDSGQRWEVHLPTNLPQRLPIEKVAERYKKYGHTVTYDLA